MTYNVHDLVRIDPAYVLATRFHDAPDWLAPSLERAPWMVVRRGLPSEELPVGVRGPERAQRFAAHISRANVLARLAPEELCQAASHSAGRLGDASRRVAAYAFDRGLVWGPVGSFGFELASGKRTTTNASDLDIVVRATGVARDSLLALDRVRAGVAAALDVRVDIELAFEIGGVALSEYVTKPGRVLAKTPRGPELVPCP